jgi:hypothetical protein
VDLPTFGKPTIPHLSPIEFYKGCKDSGIGEIIEYRNKGTREQENRRTGEQGGQGTKRTREQGI